MANIIKKKNKQKQLIFLKENIYSQCCLLDFYAEFYVNKNVH